MTIIEPAKPNINKKNILKHIGCHQPGDLSYATHKKMTKWEDKSTELMIPSLIYKKYKIKNLNGDLKLENNIWFNSNKIVRIMLDCNEIVCFLATIGNRIDKKIIDLTSKRRSSEAYILDIVGSVAVESIVNNFHDRIKKRMQAEDKDITLRMSPGYCDWPLREQKKIFSLLDAEKIGVELSASSLMQPRKTISGIFGIMPPSADCKKAAYNPCSDCRKEHCIARRTEFIYKNTTLTAS